ncbi:hypothetical protein COMNV_01202 [Commensalibacter sp. Nvir]|uniref:tRNA threonylcarbamoyladenosine biosynthesis protein TsaB n=1 Tax=Commensalibacter sp. Nvir TaxID=3069817 RepID=UPI002D43C490|nr:hypothetical protein COMNV_01202 [Commensalibacter sp. Nvir]
MIDEFILILNGASSSQSAPNFISIVKKSAERYEILDEVKTTLRGGPERFPYYYQQFMKKNILQSSQINFIAAIVGPGSFTGLRASLAFGSGLQFGLNCPVIGLTRGDVFFSSLDAEYCEKEFWHVTYARRNRVFIETNKNKHVSAYDLEDVVIPDRELWICGESAATLMNNESSFLHLYTDYKEADALKIAHAAMRCRGSSTKIRAFYPVYVDPPEAKLPQKGLRPYPL